VTFTVAAVVVKGEEGDRKGGSGNLCNGFGASLRKGTVVLRDRERERVKRRSGGGEIYVQQETSGREGKR
jgi:hypothetical protein